jgi:hypothetical protein
MLAGRKTTLYRQTNRTDPNNSQNDERQSSLSKPLANAHTVTLYPSITVQPRNDPAFDLASSVFPSGGVHLVHSSTRPLVRSSARPHPPSIDVVPNLPSWSYFSVQMSSRPLDNREDAGRATRWEEVDRRVTEL